MEGASRIGNHSVPAGAREVMTGAAAGAAAIVVATLGQKAYRAALDIHYVTQGSEVVPPRDEAAAHDLDTGHTELINPVERVDREPISFADRARKFGEQVILATDTIGTLRRGITKWRRHTAANTQAKEAALPSPGSQSQSVRTRWALPNYL